MEMDRGILFKKSFMVEPCANGSFVVRDSGRYCEMSTVWAFSSIADLLKFLSDEVAAFEVQKGAPENTTITFPADKDWKLTADAPTNPNVYAKATDDVTKAWR